MPDFFCPRCSSLLAFPDDASASTMARCSGCTVTLSLAEVEYIEWKNDLVLRIRAVDWSNFDNGEDKHDIAFRYAFAFHLAQLAGRDAATSLPALENALFRDGAPLAIARAARPFLLEIEARPSGEPHASIVRQLARRSGA